MLELTIGQTSENLIVTLNELKTLDAPNYLFVFTHVTTKEVVSFVAGPDLSTHKDRYNLFNVNTNDLFGTNTPGEWHYTAYEQDSPINTDPTLTAGIVEYGKLMLNKSGEFEYTKYNQSTTYKAYNG